MEYVSVKKCLSYKDDIKRKVEILVEKLGGFDLYINEGDRVVLKVNLLRGSPPSKAVTTHPALVEAVALKVKELGAVPIIADSPGGPFNQYSLKQAYRGSGLMRVAKSHNIKLNYNTEETKVEYSEGEISLSYRLASYIKEADVIINLPKLKTHSFTKYTGAVKNIFGVIPGLYKAEYHLKMEKINHFSQMLIDLALLVEPDLNIMDGIIGMEGEGPSSGDPRKFEYLLASPSPFALDVVGSYLLGIDPLSKVPTIRAAQERGLIADISDINFVGDDLILPSNVLVPEIERKTNLLDQKLPDWFSSIVAYFLRPRPKFHQQQCVGCGDCELNCPTDAIDIMDEIPEVNIDECIRCFCCQELCPQNAVTIKRPLLGRILFE